MSMVGDETKDNTQQPGADAHELTETEAPLNEHVDQVAEQKNADDTLNDLQRLLEEAEAKAEQQRDQFLRSQAEFQNLQRRAEKDVASAHKYALEKFANELLPVVDSLEKALEVAQQADSGANNGFSEGVELTLKMFLTSLQKFGVEVIDPVQQAFDPEWHEAMSMQPSPDVPPNWVLAVFQKGYSLNGRLLRPARVVVSSADSGPAQGGPQGIDTKA